MPTLRRTLEQYRGEDKTFIYATIMNQAPEIEVDFWFAEWEQLLGIGLIQIAKEMGGFNLYKLSDSIPVWAFDSTTDAYNASQYYDAMAAGDILFIPNRQCVAIADTWPVAITIKAGQLHIPKEGMTRENLNNIMNEYKEGDRRVNFHLSFKQAVVLAAKHNYPVLDCFK